MLCTIYTIHYTVSSCSGPYMVAVYEMINWVHVASCFTLHHRGSVYDNKSSNQILLSF